jgi:hypothetical protein
MATKNPTGGARVVPINLPRKQVAFLRRHIGSVLAGVKEDLKTPERMVQPDKARDEAAAYRDLIEALKHGELTLPNEFAHEAVATLAAEADRENEYERVALEHDALHGLLAVFGGRR